MDWKQRTLGKDNKNRSWDTLRVRERKYPKVGTY